MGYSRFGAVEAPAPTVDGISSERGSVPGRSLVGGGAPTPLVFRLGFDYKYNVNMVGHYHVTGYPGNLFAGEKVFLNDHSCRGKECLDGVFKVWGRRGAGPYQEDVFFIWMIISG